MLHYDQIECVQSMQSCFKKLSSLCPNRRRPMVNIKNSGEQFKHSYFAILYDWQKKMKVKQAAFARWILKLLHTGQWHTRAELSMEILHKWNHSPRAFFWQNRRWNITFLMSISLTEEQKIKHHLPNELLKTKHVHSKDC